jgi:glycosyl transferase, family 9
VRSIAAKVKAFFGKCKILFQIWRENYDVVVIFRSSYSSSAAIFARVARAKKIIGAVKQNEDRHLITDRLNFDQSLHEAMLCCQCLTPLGVNFKDEKTLYMPSEKNEKFKDFIFFHISSRVEQNRLSEGKILEILEFLKQRFKNIVISAEETNFGNDIAHKADVVFARTKSLDELASYIWAAKFVLTLDGGVAHLAPALGVKTIVLFGKTNPLRWAPIYGSGECIVLQSPNKIAEEIKNDEIFNKILQFA